MSFLTHDSAAAAYGKELDHDGRWHLRTYAKREFRALGIETSKCNQTDAVLVSRRLANSQLNLTDPMLDFLQDVFWPYSFRREITPVEQRCLLLAAHRAANRSRASAQLDTDCTIVESYTDTFFLLNRIVHLIATPSGTTDEFPGPYRISRLLQTFI